jgi:hypothetical protein
MPSIIIVEKLGEIKALQVKNWNESELYKKAGFKSGDGFKCYTTWNVEIDKTKYSIDLYGKTTGRANQENKYEFPPPVDSTLFFGNCVLVNKSSSGEILDLSVKEWEEIYETLYGGFEDLGNDSDDEESEDEDDFGMKRTKDGYVKDGFVVDDDESEEDADEDEDEDEDEEKIYTKTQKPKASGSSKVKTIFELKAIQQEENYLDCASELSEESYIE